MPRDLLSREQLAALARVGSLLDAAGIDHWLFGGWGVDFHVGAITRPHADVDLAVWRHDVPRIAALLHEDGWLHAPEPDEDGGTGYERAGVRLELTFLVHGGGDDVYTPLRRGRAAWPALAFGDDRGELHGVRARLVSRASLLRGKSSPRDDPADAAKDRADAAALSRAAKARPKSA